MASSNKRARAVSSQGASSYTQYWDHKRKAGKRLLNKSARYLAKLMIKRGKDVE